MKERPPKPPPERSATPREAIREALVATRDAGATATARDLGQACGLPEKDVAEHLEHLDKSLRREGLRLDVTPAECLACGYVFRDRARYTAPSACPECRSERVAPPSFKVGAGGGGKAARPPRRRDEEE